MSGGNEHQGGCDREWAIAKRIHAPIGFDIVAEVPGETAVSVLTEVIVVRWGEG
jgi:xanthine/CO dehydrogenase XdhC/CoxF family maturation factor